MKRNYFFVIAYILVPLFCFVQPCQADTFFDNFNDGNTDGWISAPPSSNYGLGNWRVESGMLVQNLGGDHYKFLVENLPVSIQSIETLLSTNDPAGYGGVTLWYQDPNNWVDVLIYPHGPPLLIIEIINGAPILSDYPYRYEDFTWYNFRVDANSLTGELAVSVDGNYLFTHVVTTDHRTGLSGLNSGNTGGNFDDFRLTSDDISPDPEPSTMLFLGSGLVGLIGFRRKFKK